MELQLIDRAEAIVKKYENELLEKGIKCEVSRKYVESVVEDTDFSYKDHINNPKYERRKNLKNKYYVIVLTVSPIKKGEVEKKECKDYSFVVSKSERVFKYAKPKEKFYDEEKILAKIEKQIQTILNKAQTKPLIKICKNNLFDALRYATLPKYNYKKSYLGKDKYTYQIFFRIAIPIIALIALIGVACLIGKI